MMSKSNMGSFLFPSVVKFGGLEEVRFRAILEDFEESFAREKMAGAVSNKAIQSCRTRFSLLSCIQVGSRQGCEPVTVKQKAWALADINFLWVFPT
ncbi:hypothetical protein SLE2022_131790 [Rubroshorea leprosula]